MDNTEIKELNNTDLIELYTLMVKIDHYDPVETPEMVLKLRKEGISTDYLGEILLERLNNVKNNI